MMEGVAVHYANRIEDVLDVALPLLKAGPHTRHAAQELATNSVS
jgi:hypothetical protein